MNKFEEELNSLPVSKSTNYTEYWNKAQLLTVFKDWQPQQALPVVPECVAEWIDKNISVAHNAELMIHNILICAIDNKNRYLFPLEVEKFVLKNPITFLNAIITGKYQVEKPQLFYLKNKLTTSYLALDINTGYYEHWGEEIIPRLPDKQGYKISFTQQEIASMQTGSYELVPMEDGE